MMTNPYRIIPVQVGTLTRFEKSVFTFGRNFGEKIEVPCIVWVVTNGSRTVIVDAGPSHPDRANTVHPAYVCPPEQLIECALPHHGVDPARVDTVVLSHLHWDHVGGVGVFPNAQFLVQRSELSDATDPLPTQRIPYEVGIRGLLPTWLSVFDRVVVCDGDYDLAPGLKVVKLPGHTSGLQALVVESNRGPALVASDAIPLVDNWAGDQHLKHIPNGIHEDLHAYYESFTRIENLAKWVVPGHDPKAFDRSLFPLAE